MSMTRSINAQTGFTLVEIMVVIFIMGIMIGLTTISIGGHSERKLETEAQRIYQKLRLLSDEAEYSGSEYGMALTQDRGYEFFRYDDQTMGWIKEDHDFLKPVTLDDGFVLALDTDKNELDTKNLYYSKPKRRQEAVDYGETKNIEPEVMFFSDGQITPFKLSLSNKLLTEKSYMIFSDNLSKLDIKINE